MPKRVEEVRLRTDRVRSTNVSRFGVSGGSGRRDSAGVGGLEEEEVDVGVKESSVWRRGLGRRSWGCSSGMVGVY